MAGSPLKTLVADHPPRLVVRYVPGADGTNAEAAATLTVAPAITAIVGEIACPVFPGPAQYLGKFILLLEENLKMRLVSADIFETFPSLRFSHHTLSPHWAMALPFSVFSWALSFALSASFFGLL
jgi:hypothetical protein